ncbi:uncharacterized protein RHO25_002977 [Cercospora beticola]|uniref:Uncharacterized protein n=1 Tax=Cercospora beticola TaxID=122368 RepID=A0ABZ0NFQ3_CERBT|nr:hypothetical protein RHO25_002977 [Cercospora beticola]
MGGLMDAIRNEPIERMVEAIVPRVLLPYKTQATFLSEIAHADPSPPGETCCFCRDSDRQASSIPVGVTPHDRLLEETLTLIAM